MRQINLFDLIEYAESTQDEANDNPPPQQGDSPFLVVDDILYCSDCGSVITPNHGLPVNEQLIVNAFLNIDPDSRMDYIDLATGEILTLHFDDYDLVDCEERLELVSRAPERYLYLESLTPTEFVQIVSNFVVRLRDSII
jgi:hypothetical protein